MCQLLQAGEGIPMRRAPLNQVVKLEYGPVFPEKAFHLPSGQFDNLRAPAFLIQLPAEAVGGQTVNGGHDLQSLFDQLHRRFGQGKTAQRRKQFPPVQVAGSLQKNEAACSDRWGLPARFPERAFPRNGAWRSGFRSDGETAAAAVVLDRIEQKH